MIVSQESLVLEARIADDDARLAELNARHKATCSMTGDRRSRKLRIIERQIRDTTKHKTEHQQRLRGIRNAPPPQGLEHKEPKIAESLPVISSKLEQLRIDCNLTYEKLADATGTLDEKAVSAHCNGKRGMRLTTAHLYKQVFQRLGKTVEVADIFPKKLPKKTPA
jgi:hypothetical protein